MGGLIRIVFPLLMLTLIGTTWFVVVSDWSVVDAFYMTIITLTTVGFREVRPLATHDKLFVCAFLVAGLGVFLYAIVQLGELVVRAELGQWWRHRNMTGAINSLQDHFIICGAGRIGKLICADLAVQGFPFVVVDHDPEVIRDCEENKWPAICNDATEDATLRGAGIERAAGLAAALESDADNLYVVITARLMSPNVQIVARAHNEASGKKLRRAGASRVVSPYESGAAKMGQLLTNPRLNEFVEIISDRRVAFDLEGLPVTATSAVAGKRLDETDFRERGVMIVAIRRGTDDIQLAPPGSTRLEPGHELFALGDTQAIREFRA